MTRTKLVTELLDLRQLVKKMQYSVLYDADQGIIDRYWRDIKAKINAVDPTIED